MESNSIPEPHTFQPSPIYLILLFIGLGLMALFAWELWQGATLGAALFLAVGGGLALWAGNALLTRLELTANALCVYSGWRGVRCVEFRQLAGVTEEGRFNPVIVLLYHPQLPTGLLDLDQVQTLLLPAVRNQAALLAQLQARHPR
jgi:hypothetical protein